MAEQLDLLDEFEASTGSSRRVTFYSVAPQFARAKVERAAPAVEAAPPLPPTASEPEAPAPSPEPALPRIITTRDELLDLIRRRRDELGITHMTIDALTGWASGYASKVLSPEPLRGLSAGSLDLLMGALALGIARVEFVEDPDQAERMRSRWEQRLRPPMRPRRTRGALLADRQQQMLASTMETANVETASEFPPKD